MFTGGEYDIFKDCSFILSYKHKRHEINQLMLWSIAQRFCPQHKEKKYFDMLLMMFTSLWANETLWGEQFFETIP